MRNWQRKAGVKGHLSSNLWHLALRCLLMDPWSTVRPRRRINGPGTIPPVPTLQIWRRLPHIHDYTCTPRFGVTFRANHGDDFAIQGLSVELTYLHHCAFAIEVFQACLRVLPKQWFAFPPRREFRDWILYVLFWARLGLCRSEV